LDALLEEFAAVFHETQGLPPQHLLCHHIHLKAGISAIVVPPTATPTCRKMNSSASVMRCSVRASSDTVCRRSPHRRY
jgi:hypothetical protein